MKDHNKLIEVINKHGVAPYKKHVIEQIQPSIRLKTIGKPCTQLGKTKLGGCPDLPRSINWATSDFDHKHLSFIGQVNLSDIQNFDKLSLLPKTGLLYFFFNFDSSDDGKVIFYDGHEDLKRAAVPEDLIEPKKSFFKRLFSGKPKKRVLEESKVDYSVEYYIPSWDSLKIEKIQKDTRSKVRSIDAFAEGIFEDVYEDGETETTSNHHLLGNYQGIQNEYHELNFLDVEDVDIQNLPVMNVEEALNWKLLLQFDSDRYLDMNYGDWGRIYFFIHKDDLEKGDFSKVKISADCY